MRYCLQVAYDGTNFSGWQIQKVGRTVQEEIEKAISQIAKTPIKIVGSGRTDAGVHAMRQYAHFDFPIKMTVEQIKFAIQTKLPRDVKTLKVILKNDDFHARFDATLRTYKYFITKNRNPFNRYYSSYFPKMNINKTKINSCLPYFLGEHDFSSFAKFNPDVKNYVCKIEAFTFEEFDDNFVFTISANRFLHNMVRRIVGTVINITNSTEKVSIIEEFFKIKNHKLVTTASTQGLYLFDVKY
ncbi:MAG: tRNA pseudouridine(38-40) synthase TruA [Candidatus Cloacimonetes bacterium]|jgi:tRNA pseudouridine38-40 synthase|nr:tRNA pseudouridine(38-40) synthase TruA [Candidatus Cloacimonadota bacterium]MBT6993690.1 tRNA pseudouridine(38-40) synthase TruA [Candidatus Cloacimonadota bacterium]MBT7469639.1 tRNA pseudouridine(38-40) synthase TruA [Candidatus Cloacimonadota bacterium]